MNNVVLIGRLTRDPELRYTPNNQTPVTTFTLAVDRPVQAGKERQADFIRITVFGKQAENVNRYLTKGSKAAVQGSIQTGSYQNREGKTVYTTDIIANRVEFLDSAPRQGGQGFGGSGRGDTSFDDGGAFGGFGNSGLGMDDSDLPDSFESTEDDVPF